MLVYEKDCCKTEAEVFKALGHPIRLWIVKQLADGAEHCVCEFVNAVGVKFATVSQRCDRPVCPAGVCAGREIPPVLVECCYHYCGAGRIDILFCQEFAVYLFQLLSYLSLRGLFSYEWCCKFVSGKRI